MTAAIEMPGRKWADDEPAPEPIPTVLVSSRDGVEAPHVRDAAALAKSAERLGWTARITYALADVPDQLWMNGRVKKAAHRLASVVVRLARGAARIWAAWQKAGDGPWSFVCAYAGPERLLLRRGKGSTLRLISEALS